MLKIFFKYGIFIFVGLQIFAILFWPNIFIRNKSDFLSHIDLNEEVLIEGQIVSMPENREFNLQFILKVENLKFKNQVFYPKDEKVLIKIEKYKKLEYGDNLAIQTKLKVPENFENDNQIVFDYKNYLAKDNIYSIAAYAKILKHESNSKYLLSRELFKLKNRFISKTNELLPSPESELLSGILLGVKNSIDEDLENNFRRVGLIHIIVLSGYNVTIIAEAILFALFFVPRFLAIVLGGFLIILFALMVGSGATILRASIMALIALVGRLFFRTYDVNKALFLAGGIMLWHNPKILLHDPSFQLSFLATFGLINFGKVLVKHLSFLPEKFGLRELTVTTLSTQIAVLPLLIKMTGEVSIIALPVNLIALPAVPPSMLFGFLLGLVGLAGDFFIKIKFVFIFLEKIFQTVSFLLLNYIILLTEFFGSQKIAVLNLPKLNDWQIVVLYLIIVSFLYYIPIKIGKKIIDILHFARRLIIKNKRVFPHIKS